jgi:hypothetical protein
MLYHANMPEEKIIGSDQFGAEKAFDKIQYVLMTFKKAIFKTNN